MQPVQLITMIMIMLKMTMLTMTIVMMMFMLRVVGGDDDRGARSGGDQNASFLCSLIIVSELGRHSSQDQEVAGPSKKANKGGKAGPRLEAPNLRIPVLPQQIAGKQLDPLQVHQRHARKALHCQHALGPGRGAQGLEGGRWGGL